MSKKTRTKKKKVAAPVEVDFASLQPRYACLEQQKAVKAVVTFLLNYAKDEDLDHVSKATLNLAVAKYVDLVDAGEEPGYTEWRRILGDDE